MKALIFHEPGQIAVETIEDPSPGPGEVILQVGSAGVCASDLRVFRGEKHAAPGVVPGHEFAGTVLECADGVDVLKPGQRVAVYPIIACGGCDFCRRGLRNRCFNRRTLGYDLNGGLAEYVRLPSAIVAQGHAMALSDTLPMSRAALTEPIACVLNSLESCNFRPGSSVAILGAGPMALALLLSASLWTIGERLLRASARQWFLLVMQSKLRTLSKMQPAVKVQMLLLLALVLTG